MKRNLITAILMTVVTTILFGLVYPLVVTALAQVLFPDKANGQLIVQDGKVIGSRIIAQPLAGQDIFIRADQRRGTDMTLPTPAQRIFGPTNKKLVDRVKRMWLRPRAKIPRSRFRQTM